MSATNRLLDVFAEAVTTLDERYDGYRIDATRALSEIIATQRTAATDTARGKDVDRVIAGLGQKLHAHTTNR